MHLFNLSLKKSQKFNLYGFSTKQFDYMEIFYARNNLQIIFSFSLLLSRFCEKTDTELSSFLFKKQYVLFYFLDRASSVQASSASSLSRLVSSSWPSASSRRTCRGRMILMSFFFRFLRVKLSRMHKRYIRREIREKAFFDHLALTDRKF